MGNNEARVDEIFNETGITDYVVHEHDAIFSTEDAEEKGLIMEGLNLKNLLIKDKKRGNYYMLIMDDNHHMDTKHYKQVTGWTKIRFSTEEEMWDLLQLKPGSVTPFALFNDVDKQITVVLEKMIVDASDDELVNFHPCRNTATLSLKKKDFMKFLDYVGNKVIEEQ